MKSFGDVKIAAIILAAGSGSRMNSTLTKQRMTVCSETVLHRSIRAFDECRVIDKIVVVCRADEIEIIESTEFSDIKTPILAVVGGDFRAESARLGFEAVRSDADFVAIHDAARCLITPDMIERVACAAIEFGAASASTPLVDTLKRSDESGNISETVPRSDLHLAQTPQIFATDVYARAIRHASDAVTEITDDNMLAELLGERIHLVDTGRDNIKITTPSDIEYAEFIIRKRENMLEKFRTGHGYDVHRLVADRDLIIGGVNIPYELGLLGHSDADVLVHAVMDAILGAAALGDIGRHFPDTDEKYMGISSIALLSHVSALIRDRGYSIVNIDATLVLQRPKIAQYVPDMIKNISDTLGIDYDRVNIKATTEEHLGFTGSGEGAAAHAVATIKK